MFSKKELQKAFNYAPIELKRPATLRKCGHCGGHQEEEKQCGRKVLYCLSFYTILFDFELCKCALYSKFN